VIGSISRFPHRSQYREKPENRGFHSLCRAGFYFGRVLLAAGVFKRSMAFLASADSGPEGRILR
jgi:hypothetical protein